MSKGYKLKAKSFNPIGDNIFVTDMEEGMRLTRGGLILPDDNFTDRGVRPRWCRVWSVGPEVDYLEPGEWVLVEHGRWTLRTTLDLENQDEVDVWKIDPNAILLVSTDEECPADSDRHHL